MKRKPKKKGGKKGSKDRDYFEDLREMETHHLEEKINDHKSSIRSIESQLDSMGNERNALISTVQVLRNALGQSGGISKERQALLTELRERTPKINEAKAERDDINQRVSPPTSVIEKLIKRTWRDLTTIRDDATRAPQLANEIQKFSFFFELIEMHKLKQQSDAAHNYFVDLIRLQKETIKKLDELKEDDTIVAEQASDENPRLTGMNINRKEEKKLNKRIEKMLVSIRSYRKELNKSKKEIARLESFLRIRKADEQRGKKVRVRINSLREHAISGGSLSVEDMARLLHSGGLSKLQQTEDSSKQDKKKKKTLGKRKIQARRSGVSRTYKRRDD
ncbi:MAG: hypothetical protein CMO20_04165 [Thermoplasmata archaeon]|nr:hypothetical protein [Thermoplasmata archaeon]|tara:strand:+ start:1504 stop:2508 length:1005 start_codon:yes stop_codon:yes gene_type:complete